MSRSLNLLNSVAVTTAATTAYDAISGLDDMSHLTFQATLDWGSGGTAVKVFLQTTLDRGATWIDIACLAFASADATKIVSIAGGATVSTPPTTTDGTMTDDTTLDGVLGDQLRVKTVSTGTYAGSTTISANVVAKTGVSTQDSTITGLPSAIGQQAAAASTSVVLASDGYGSIETVTLAVTTTGADGSATGTADSVAIEGYLIDVFVDWDATAPVTSDLLLLYLSPSNGQILSVSNSVTDDFFMPLMQAQNASGVDLGIYGRYAINGTIQAQVSGSNALAPAVTLRVRYARSA